MPFKAGEKFSEIYNLNKRSPVFLRVAAREIAEKNFHKAVEILESAVKDHPGNASLYFLLGKSYSGMSDFKAALRNFKKGSELIKSEKTYQYYLKEIEFQKRKKEELDITGDKISSSDYSVLIDEEAAAGKTTKAPPVKEIDDNLVSETLAKIYLGQNEKAEAVKVYKKLIRKYPLRKLYFEAKIAEITSR